MESVSHPTLFETPPFLFALRRCIWRWEVSYIYLLLASLLCRWCSHASLYAESLCHCLYVYYSSKNSAIERNMTYAHDFGDWSGHHPLRRGRIKSISHLDAVRRTYTGDKWRSAPSPEMMMKRRNIAPFAKVMHRSGLRILPVRVRYYTEKTYCLVAQSIETHRCS